MSTENENNWLNRPRDLESDSKPVVVPFMMKLRDSCGMCGNSRSAAEDRLKELQDHRKTLEELSMTIDALNKCLQLILSKQGKIMFSDDVIDILEKLKRSGVIP